MVLMSDTGGGHRASAEALQAGFEQLYGDDFQVCRPLVPQQSLLRHLSPSDYLPCSFLLDLCQLGP